LLEANVDKVNWYNLSANPNIFTYDYEAMKAHFYDTVGRELMEKMWHPTNMAKWAGWNGEEEEEGG